MASLTELWLRAADAAPHGWTVQGLRCASTGLSVAARTDRWVAEACGPNGACERVELQSADAALTELATRLTRR